MLIALTAFVHVDLLRLTMLTIGNVSKKLKMTLTHALAIARLMKLVTINATRTYLGSRRNVLVTVDVLLVALAKVDILVKNISRQFVSEETQKDTLTSVT